MQRVHPMCGTCGGCEGVQHETMVELVERVCERHFDESGECDLIEVGGRDMAGT